MSEVTITGINGITYPYLASWHWHVALYLFIGGLVAGLMIFSALFRLTQQTGFSKAIFISDLVGLPLLAGGMFLLWIDLARRWNAWRFFATLEPSSPMSWGSWILLFCMILLFLRLLAYVPQPTPKATKNRLQRGWLTVWGLAAAIGQWTTRHSRGGDLLTVLLGVSLGFYTGLLLNTIPARPLWNTSLLPFLFLTSGLASGCAFLCLFLGSIELKKLLPVSLLLGTIETFLILSYILTLSTGTDAMRQASNLFLGGAYTFTLWAIVIGLGLIIPIAIETLEVWQRRRHIPALLTRGVPILTLAGGIVLRFVIVDAGLHSFM